MLTVDLHLLLQKFNKYTFVEDTHTYYCNGYPVSISVTTFIQRYFPKFDFDNISIKYANKHNLDVEDVRANWRKTGMIASTAGTIVHSHIENLKRGTPINIPANPHISPKRKIANNTQKLEIPVVLPRILGPIILPSICCSIKSNIIKYIHWTGFTINIRSAERNRPIYHPKKGIILNIPTITATNISLIRLAPGLNQRNIIIPT